MKNIHYITAGAGSGKTYTLTHKLADILSQGKVRPSEVIVTTFTKAAAAEIKDRARQVLLEKDMVLEAAQLDSAAIGTIHSVAQMLVNRYWYELDAAPNADLITDEDKRIYRNHSLGVMLKESNFKKEMDDITQYFKVFKPKKYDENFIPKDDLEYWTADVEKVVGKMSYYEIKDLAESQKRSLAEVDRLTGLSDEERQIMKDCIKAVFKLAEEWTHRYEEYKHQIGVIDYDDMERGLRDLLKKDSVRQDIAEQYKLVMVDEFQDCNPIQLEIFDMLSEIVAVNNALPQSSIWVGDPKQAIYGFRGSDTELINRVASNFPPIGKPANALGLISTSLDTSYRTRQPLVKKTNELFGSRFEGMTELKSNRGFVSGMKTKATEFWTIPGDNKQDRAELLARHIRKIVEDGKYQIVPKDEDTLQPLEYGDIALLAYSKNQVKDLVNALKDEGIPVWAPEVDIVDRAEVQLVLSLLQVAYTLQHPKSKRLPHEWASLLKLWCGLKTEEVLQRRLDYLKGWAEGEEDKWDESLTELAPLRVALKHALNLPLDECMTSLILELSLYEHVAKWGEKEVRQQNLKTLQQQAQNFVARCARLNIQPIIKEFVKYLDDVEIAPSKEMPKDMVKVVTYHGSKGLEWPFVILYSLERKFDDKLVEYEFMGVHEQVVGFNPKTIKQQYWLHYIPNSYIYGEQCKRIKQSGVMDWDIVQTAKERLSSEALRLLYVGITRARDFLVLTATGTGKTEPPYYSEMFWLKMCEMQPKDFDPLTTYFEPLYPKVRKKPEPSKAKNPRQATIDKYNKEMELYILELKAYEEAKASNEEWKEQRHQLEDYFKPDLPELKEEKRDKLYLLPSKLTKVIADKVPPIKIAQIAPGIEVNQVVNDSEESTLSKSGLGICIHKIFASCPSDGTKPTEAEREAFVAMAAQTLHNCNLSEAVKSPEQLATALFALHEWLAKEYGPAQCIEKEYPFCYSWGDRQIMKGEIDMIWRTEEGDVIVDFKNHVDDEAKIAIDEVCPHAEKYVPQLQAYRKILMDAGRKVKDTLLYYDLKGYIVRVK